MTGASFTSELKGKRKEGREDTKILFYFCHVILKTRGSEHAYFIVIRPFQSSHIKLLISLLWPLFAG